jgi:enoyl-CoA hydratase/carnithine racemase
VLTLTAQGRKAFKAMAERHEGWIAELFAGLDQPRFATVTLNRPERKNPLTFQSYRELTDFFRACAMDEDVKASSSPVPAAISRRAATSSRSSAR